MSLSEYVRYENNIRRFSTISIRKTTKEEWTERFEFVYKCSKDYISLRKKISDAHVKYITYKNKHLYTSAQDTTYEIQSELYKIYYDEYNKQFELSARIIKAFKERFPNIKNPTYELEHHYFHCCELYEAHKLKGINYSLPFPMDNETPTTPEDFKLGIDEPLSPESNPTQVNPAETKPPESKPPQKTESFEEFLMRVKTKPLAIRQKKTYPKKHTLSILLTQEKEKTKKLQEIITQKDLKH
jgi:hypothetical protein